MTLCLLSFLENQLLARILDALPMVGVGNAEAADVGGNLAHQLLVNAG